MSDDRIPTIPVSKGGTGADTAEGARANLDAAATAHSHVKEDITNFPTTMPPSSHTHVKADISDFAHTHTKEDITNFPTTMPPSTHTHVKADISNFPTEMTPTAHKHNAADVTCSDGATVEAMLTEISGQIGDVSTMLDTINGEVI